MHLYPPSIAPKEAQKWLQSPEPPLCVDVRELHEVAFCSLAGSLHIPLGSLAEKLDSLPQGKPLVLICHHGSRSAQACDFLRTQGYEAINMVGGIDLWSVECDPSVARY